MLMITIRRLFRLYLQKLLLVSIAPTFPLRTARHASKLPLQWWTEDSQLAKVAYESLVMTSNMSSE